MVPDLDLGDLFCIYLNLWQILCKEEFFFMYFCYVYRIYVWVCDFYVLFLVISIFGCVLKGKMRNLKVNYCRFM